MNLNRNSLGGHAAKWLSSLILALFTTVAAAESWPAKPITMIVGYPPGGTNDVVARIVAEGLSSHLNTQVVVDNRGGASGTIGAQTAARANPDGYTIYMMSSAQVLAPSIRSNLGFDPIDSFDPIALAASTTYVMVVGPQVKARTVGELIAYVKANPGELKYGSIGVGSGMHVTNERFKSLTGLGIDHVPYKGDTPMMTDLMGGHVSLAFIPIPGTLPFLKAGKLIPLAVTSDSRVSILPDVPTVVESGGPDGLSMSAWWGLVAPKGLPGPILEQLRKATADTLEDPAVQAKFTDLALERQTNAGDDFAAFIAAEKKKFAEIVQASKITAE